MTRADLVAILAEIKYKDWVFLADQKGDGYYLQVLFYDMGMQKGRKWYVSPHATKSEIVQTVLKAVLTAEEHEAREKFTYQGRPIYGPHLSVDRLVELYDEPAQNVFDVREA